jgi:hypothetical protein
MTTPAKDNERDHGDDNQNDRSAGSHYDVSVFPQQ